MNTVTVYQVSKNETDEIKSLLKSNGIKASVRLGTNRWYILVNAKSLNEQALELIEASGKWQAISIVKNSQAKGILNIIGQMMIERVQA